MGRLGAFSRSPTGLLLAVLVLAALSGCASSPDPPAGVVHVVRPGETVWRIAHRYGVSVETVVRANGIRDVNNLQIGQRLWIPGGRPGAGSPLPPPPARGRESGRACIGAANDGLAFSWPVRGKLTSGFGRRGRRRHDGIDISAPRGTPIRAAEAGRVIHSGGGLGAYGKVVIVRHTGGWATVYAHNRRNAVAKGAFVERGEAIGEVGTSGNATGPHVHFEVRHDGRPQNPLPCLP